MTWIQNLTKALRIIEDNLTNELDVEDIAKQVFSSGSNFQRVFNAVTGIPVSEYIRNRRLTLAGQDLLYSKTKVIDVAMRYQYDTSESFSKAFLRFHGISPSAVKKHGDSLKNYRPLVINITLQGGFGMSRLILEDFDIPFSGFAGTSFINCFTSTYLFLEKISGSAQERYFFFFDTMCGRSSLRCHYNDWLTPMQKMICESDFYDGGSDNNIDFLFGLTGYEYRKLTTVNQYNDALASSIDGGKPVIAKVKTGKMPYRVITGYDENSLICPDYEKRPKQTGASPRLRRNRRIIYFWRKNKTKIYRA
jgi:AraC-like DNA-binding protein